MQWGRDKADQQEAERATDEMVADESYVVIGISASDYALLDSLLEVNPISGITLRKVTPASSHASVVIASVHERGNIELEGITLQNEGQLVDMRGWTLQDEDGNVFEFGEVLIFSNAQHTVYTGDGQNTPIATFRGLGSSILEAGEIISLYDADGNLQSQYIVPGE